MNEIYSGKIMSNGFQYRLSDDILNSLVAKEVLGEVGPVSWHEASPSSHVCYSVENGYLFATRFITNILSDDLDQILNQDLTPIETKEIAGYRSNDPHRLVLVELTYDLHLPIEYTGSIRTFQIYVDETRYPNGLTHKDPSTFIFINGFLNDTASTVSCNQKTVLEDTGRIWSDDISSRLAKQTTHPIPYYRRYYVEPIGSMRQNDYITDVVCHYKSSFSIPDSVLDWIFSHEHPVLRTHLKVETAPGSCSFVDQVYDLIAEAKKVGDHALLEKLVHYGIPQEHVRL